MKKRFKFLITLLGLILVSIAVFYFWGSSPWYLGKKSEIKIYESNSSTAKDTLKVLTYNIGYLSGMSNNLPVEMPEQLFKKNLSALIKYLRLEDPDIIGFQEIDFGGNRSHFQNQLDSIANQLGYHSAYASINWDKNYVPFPYWPPKYHFGKMLSGQVILSKYPLSNPETIVLEKPVNAPFYYNKFYLDRLIQMADVTIGEKVIKVMNLHLEAFDKETREQQAIAVRYHYDKFNREMPVLLIGDFNSRPSWGSGDEQTMATILNTKNIDSSIKKDQYEASPSSFFTFSSGDPYQMIDYVLYNPSAIAPIESKVGQKVGEISDHFPVSMTFTFKHQNDSTIKE